jgi:hypothetical protein
MKKSIQWRLALIALSVVIALFLFLPSTPLTEQLPGWWHHLESWAVLVIEELVPFSIFGPRLLKLACFWVFTAFQLIPSSSENRIPCFCVPANTRPA